MRPFLNTLAVGCVALAGFQALNGRAWVIVFLLIGGAIILRAVATRC